MTRANPLKSRIKNFGSNFVDSVTLPDLEFHLGNVERVFTNRQDLKAYTGKQKNRIPTNPSGVILIRNRKGILPTLDETIAKPMLRGISDSIARGDLVIFCNIGTESYYLGPINTTNDITKTPNPSNIKNPLLDSRKDLADGYSINFPPEIIPVSKLQKTYIPETDYPKNSQVGDLGTTAYHEGSFSDIVLDGRFGNSIRVGARHSMPILNIHNGRFSNWESLSMGSLISMTSMGSFDDHWIYNNGFKLSYDVLNIDDENKKPMGYGNNPEGGEVGGGREDSFDYSYSSIDSENKKDQMILFSDRITFDARENDFTVSAFRNINFGAGKNLTITNKGFSVIESKNIYIGKEAKNKAQPMVLGDELRILLLDIMNILQNSRALVQGVPIPLVDQNSAPMFDKIQTIIESLQPRTLSGDPELPQPGNTKFLSQYHYVEQNVRP
jgi:hypothetical protein